MAEQDGLVEHRLSQASLFKSQGNTCYSEHRIREAVSLYHRALLQLRSLDPSLLNPLHGLGPSSVELTPQQMETLRNLQADCYSNLAACLLQNQPPRYDRVYECSLQALKIQPHNVKALYRAGVSSYHLQDYTTAHSYLTKAAAQQPKDTNIRQYLQLTDTAISASREKEKQRYQGMFD
ncbi:tetratricopeptide repeat protein 9C isoform X1 [Hyla sarda]|uniref:tetratricopeptide repeat protein 9C isoform X1 n=1 Tax=Hyla sarda TaxID=327740 RepID=UPI0024C21F2D|nr:tetratricopeptide repeat protein 9C isoform X1 [Hyla sarda]